MPGTRRSIESAIWRAEDLGSAEMLRGRFADYSYDPHTHDTACFSLITRGAINIRVRGGEFVTRVGDLFMVDADEVHAGWPIDGEGWALRTLYVSLGHLTSRAIDDDRRAPVQLAGPFIHDPVLARTFAQMHRCSEIGGPALLRQERYLEFISRLFERHTHKAPAPPTAGKENRAVRLARDFIDHRLDVQVSLAEIAEAAGLPPFRLLRAFTRDVGMSPHAYQRQARVRFAISLIRVGQPLADVAAASGFADQAHLTRFFRRTMGVTPGAYRAAVTGKSRGPRASDRAKTNNEIREQQPE